MKNLYRVALLAALGLGAVSAAQAQTSDLLLGFNDAAGPSSAQNDYVIDLGLTGAQLAADGYNLTINNAFSASTFNTAFGSDANDLTDVAAGIVGGITTNPKQLYATSPSAPNTITSSSQFNNAINAATSPTIGEYASASAVATANWSQIIAASPTAAGTEVSGTSEAAEAGNPMGLLSSGVLTLNLYENTLTSSGTHQTVGTWAEEGTVTINANNDTVTFSAVPEPATYGLLAAGGLLILAVRRQLTSKNA